MRALAWTVLWGILSSCLQCRFLKKMLGEKYSYTYLWFYLGTLVYGQLNVRFTLAGTTLGNLIYLCSCSFVLNMLLFHGSAVKKSFFTLWVYCVPGVALCAVWPIFHALAITGGQNSCSDIVLNMLNITSHLIQFLMMEILQQRLYLLKRDFTDRDAIYFLYIILFIYAAVTMQNYLFLGASDWTKEALWVFAARSSLLAFGGLGLYIFCILMLEKRLVERLAKQQYQMMSEQLEVSKEQYAHLVKIRHDMKNHGLCLAQLLSEGKTPDALHYLEQCNIRMEQGENIVRTGSVFVDALLNPKYQQACESGIDISIQMSVPGEDQIEPVDLCCLLANALDNAMEACQREMKEGKPAGWIRMKAQMHSNYWVLEISNSINTPVAMRGGRFLSSKRTGSEGVGLQNIRTVVGRYDGVLELQSGTCFTLSVMLPLTAKKNPSAS